MLYQVILELNNMPRGIYKRTKENTSKNAKLQVGRKHKPETILKLKELHKKENLSLSTRKKMSEARIGKKESLKTRKKKSEALKGSKSYLWKGGITQVHQKIRQSLEYKLWRTAVFERDNYTCIWCGDNKGGNLEADHIKPFAYYPELRFAIDNGRTLCKPCHRTTDTWGEKAKKSKVNNPQDSIKNTNALPQNI